MSYIISYHIISYHITSYHIISYHIISYHIIYHIISYHIISYHIISYIMSYHIIYHISYHIIYHILSYHITYHIYHISYHISYIISPSVLLILKTKTLKSKVLAHSYKIRRSTGWLFCAALLFLPCLNPLTPFFVLETRHSYFFSFSPLPSPRYFRSHTFVTDMHDNMTCDKGIQYQALPFTQQIASSDEGKVQSDV